MKGFAAGIPRSCYKASLPRFQYTLSYSQLYFTSKKKAEAMKVREIKLELKLKSPWSWDRIHSFHHTIQTCPRDTVEPPLFSRLGGEQGNSFSSLQLTLEQEKTWCSLSMVRPELPGEMHTLCNVQCGQSRCAHS